MRSSASFLTAAALAVVLGVVPFAHASDGQTVCRGSAGRVSVVSDADGHQTIYDSQGGGGAPQGFDPQPLLTTTVTVGGNAPSCLVAHFSVHTLVGNGVGDELAAFEVTVDGVPMIGHTSWCSDGEASNFACVVANHDDAIAMHSYDFFAAGVTPGKHKVEVRYAGCCNGLGAYVGGATLTLEHP
jgi:hypothetical protein